MAKGSEVTFAEILRQTIERDASSLRQAEDAVYVDSSDLTVEQVVEKMLEVINLKTPAD